MVQERGLQAAVSPAFLVLALQDLFSLEVLCQVVAHKHLWGVQGQGQCFKASMLSQMLAIMVMAV